MTATLSAVVAELIRILANRPSSPPTTVIVSSNRFAPFAVVVWAFSDGVQMHIASRLQGKAMLMRLISDCLNASPFQRRG